MADKSFETIIKEVKTRPFVQKIPAAQSAVYSTSDRDETNLLFNQIKRKANRETEGVAAPKNVGWQSFNEILQRRKPENGIVESRNNAQQSFNEILKIQKPKNGVFKSENTVQEKPKVAKNERGKDFETIKNNQQTKVFEPTKTKEIFWETSTDKKNYEQLNEEKNEEKNNRNNNGEAKQTSEKPIFADIMSKPEDYGEKKYSFEEVMQANGVYVPIKEEPLVLSGVLKEELAAIPKDYEHSDNIFKQWNTMNFATGSTYIPRDAGNMLTKEELNTLGYLLEKENKYSAKEYMKAIGKRVTARYDRMVQGSLSDKNTGFMEEARHRLATGFEGVEKEFLGGATYAAQGLAYNVQNLIDGIMLGDMDTREWFVDMGKSRFLERADEAKELALMETSPVGRFIGSGVMSIGGNLLNMLLFPGYAPIAMAVGAAGRGAYDARGKGAEPWQQLAMGAGSGLFEYFGEKVSIGALENLAGKELASSFGNAVKDITVQMATEAGEEAATEAANIVWDMLIMKDNSDMSKYIDNYIAENPEHGEDNLRLAGEALKYAGGQIVYAAAQGAFSGGIMGAGARAMNPTQRGKMGGVETNLTPQKAVEYAALFEEAGAKLAGTQPVAQINDTQTNYAANEQINAAITDKFTNMNNNIINHAEYGNINLNTRAITERLQNLTPNEVGAVIVAPEVIQNGITIESKANDGKVFFVANVAIDSVTQPVIVAADKDSSGQYRLYDVVSKDGKVLLKMESSEFALLGNGEFNFEITKRSQEAITKDKRVFTKKMIEIFNFNEINERSLEVFSPVMAEIESSMLEHGEVTPETAESTFNKIYQQKLNEDSEVFEQQKELARELRDTEWQMNEELMRDRKFVQYTFNNPTIMFGQNGEGVPIAKTYAELVEMEGELFPAGITETIEQMEKIQEFTKNNQEAAKRIDGVVFGDMDTQKQNARILYDVEIAKLQDNTEIIYRYEQGRKQKAEQSYKTEQKARNMSANEQIEIEREVRVLSKQLEAIQRKAFLTEEDKTYIDAVLDGKADIEVIPQNLNAADIRTVYEIKEQIRQLSAPVKSRQKIIKANAFETAMQDIENSNSWKDKAMGLQYQRETVGRNIRDIAKNDTNIEKLVYKYDTHGRANEAEATRFKEKMRKKLRGLNLNEQESVYAQMLGELRPIQQQVKEGEKVDSEHLNELQTETYNFHNKNSAKIDSAKVDKAIIEARGIYEEAFTEINKTYMANGYAPMPYRKGYFPHFNKNVGADTMLAKIAEFVGIDVTADSLPTEIAGMTDTFSPGRRYNQFANERKGNKTEYNLLEGMDKYLDVAADVIYRTEDIQNWRAVEKALRYKYTDEGGKAQIRKIGNDDDLTEVQKVEAIAQVKMLGDNHLTSFVQYAHEQGNIIANKKSKIDRGTESFFNRKIYQIVNKLFSRVSANMVAGNISSALTNFIPLTQALGECRTTSVLTAMRQVTTGAIKSDGLTGRSRFLTNRFGSDALNATIMDKTVDILSIPFEAVDSFTAEVVVRAKYTDNIRDGMSEQTAIDDADSYAEDLIGDRSKGAMPQIFYSRSPLVKVFTMFQLEMNNQLSYLFKDLPRRIREKGAEVILFALIKMFLGAFFLNEVYEKVTGRRPALDPIGIAAETYKDIEEGKNTSEIMSNLAENTLGQLPFVGPMFGGGRFPVQGAIPDVGKIATTLFDSEMSGEKKKDVLGKEAEKILYYWLLPLGGGQVKKTVEAVKTLSAGASYTINNDGDKRLRYDMEKPKWNEIIQAILFGPYATPQARAYVEGGFKTKGVEYTKEYEAAKKQGISAETFEQWWDIKKNTKADKDAEGKTIPGSKKQKMISAVNELDITQEQKQYLLDMLESGEVKSETYIADYAQAASAGINEDVFRQWWDIYRNTKADKDANGKTINGSKKRKLVELLNTLPITLEQKKVLLRQAGYKV